MKTLAEICSLLAREGKKNLLSALTFDLRKESHQTFLTLYKKLANNELKEDGEAQSELFGPDGKNTAYKSFKRKFKERMIDGLFFLDIESGNKSTKFKNYFFTNKYIQAGKILLAKGARNSAVDLFYKAHKRASESGFLEENMAALKQLKRHHSLTGNKSLFDKYQAKYSEAKQKYQLESEAEEMWEELMMEYSSSISTKPELAEKAGKYNERIAEAIKLTYTPNLHLYYYRIKLAYYQIIRDYRTTFEVACQGKENIKSHPEINSNFTQGELSMTKLQACLHLQDYKAGTEASEECKQYFPPHSINRLLFFEYYFLLAMHTQRFQTASKIFNEATQHPRFNYLPNARQEKWQIFEAYLFYVRESFEETDETSQYNFYKLFNELPVFSKDKKGFNVAILIIQFLFFLKRGQKDAIIRRADALKTYNYRYLSKDFTPRSRAFINMLIKTERYNFNPDELKSAIKPYEEVLTESQHNYIGRIESMEVIPYEILWDWALQTMQESRKTHT